MDNLAFYLQWNTQFLLEYIFPVRMAGLEKNLYQLFQIGLIKTEEVFSVIEVVDQEKVCTYEEVEEVGKKNGDNNIDDSRNYKIVEEKIIINQII